MILVGLRGISGSGKTTVAKALVNWGFLDVALADPIKRIMQQVYGFSIAQLWMNRELRDTPDTRYPLEDGTYLTPRRALQLFGTEAGRAAHPDTWVHLLLATVQKLQEAPAGMQAYYVPWEGVLYRKLQEAETARTPSVVVSDVRFANEIAGIKLFGGQVWEIRRSEAGLSGTAGRHSSEQPQDLPPADVVLDNNGPQAALLRQAVEQAELLLSSAARHACR